MGWKYLVPCARRARTLPCAGRPFAAAAIALILAHPALAQERDTARTAGEILDPIIVVNEADMDFGDITPRGTDGTVVLNPGAAATCTPNNGILRTGTCRAARFDGVLPFVHVLQVTKPAGDQISLVGPGGETMRLHDFTFAKGGGLMLGGSATNPTYLVIGGTFIIYVGGTLDVAGDQAPGVYNGTFELTFNYD